ncbi:MAG: UDP-N-acetylmuramoyl-tripeptide--D-alanyl-D-alanine ligase [bacterium]
MQAFLQDIYKILIFLIIIKQIFYWVYLWQLKEYRLDRFIAHFTAFRTLKSVFFEQFNFSQILRPKFTARAMVIVAFSFMVNILFASYIGLFSLLFVPFGVFIALFVTSFPFILEKYRIYSKAGKKMYNFEGKVIGITGSFGKTSTKELLYHILSKHFKTAKTSSFVNTQIGIGQDIIKNISGKEEIFIVEMGAYKRGEIKKICAMVKPKIGIITGLGSQHLKLFGNFENLKKAKYELIDSIPKNGIGFIVNRDFDERDAKKVQVSEKCLEFDFQTIHFKIPVFGRQLVQNIIAAVKVSEFLGISMQDSAKDLRDFSSDVVYPKVIVRKRDIRFIDNTHNLNAEAFISLIKDLDCWKGYKKVVVTPGIIELGESSKKIHKEIGKILTEKADYIIVTKKEVFDDLNLGKKGVLISDFKLLKRKIEDFSNPKTVFLFAGRIPHEGIF